MNWRHVRRKVGSLLYPPVCVICREHLMEKHGLACKACEKLLPRVQPPYCPGCGGTIDGILTSCADCVRYDRPWQDAVTCFVFAGEARQLIHRYKYLGDVALVRYLSEQVYLAWKKHASGSPDILVSVPLHWRRQLKRGYNQSALLAQSLSERIQVPVITGLARTAYTKPQAGLTLAARRQNTRKAFAVKSNFEFSGKRVLLCDDVFTTGSTLEACTAELLQAGAAAVDVLTLARG